MRHGRARHELPAGGDPGSRARWTTTLVDLGALVLSMFVLILVTQQQQQPQAPRVGNVAAPLPTEQADQIRQVGLESQAASAALARRRLALARLRQELHGAGLDGLVTARIDRDGLTLALAEPLVRPLLAPQTPAAGGAAASLAARLRILTPLLRGTTLTYVGRGVDTLGADLLLAERVARRLGDAGLLPGPEAILAPSAPAGAPPAELHLLLEDA